MKLLTRYRAWRDQRRRQSPAGWDGRRGCIMALALVLLALVFLCALTGWPGGGR